MAVKAARKRGQNSGKPPREDSRQGEFAILKIAFLLAALDGKIDETEREMYDRLAEQCKDVDVDLAQKVLKEVDAATDRLLKSKNDPTLVAASGMLGTVFASALSETLRPSQKEFLDSFMKEVDAVCDWPSFVRDSSRVRRAFVMWTAMAMADGDYSAIERAAIRRLRDKVNSYELIGEDFLKEAESKIGEIQKLSGMIGMSSNLKKSSEFNDRREAAMSDLDVLIRG